jgi:hypothetical protein
MGVRGRGAMELRPAKNSTFLDFFAKNCVFFVIFKAKSTVLPLLFTPVQWFTTGSFECLKEVSGMSIIYVIGVF